MSNLHGRVYVDISLRVTGLRFRIKTLIRCVTKASRSNRFGVSRLDVAEGFEPLHQFIERTLSTVIAVIVLFLEFHLSCYNKGRI